MSTWAMLEDSDSVPTAQFLVEARFIGNQNTRSRSNCSK
jgi:hypothetical protein